MSKFIRTPRWVSILIEINKRQNSSAYCERLNRVIKGSRTHLREVIKSLSESKLIQIFPSNKIKRLELTHKGKRVAELLNAVNYELSC